MILLDPDLALDLEPPQRAAAGRPPTTLSRSSRVPSPRLLTRFLTLAREAVGLDGEVSVLLTTDGAIRKLNRSFRGVDKATDVLSFPSSGAPAGAVAGDIAISVPTALRAAREEGHTLTVEIKVLILHGLLHLAGYDHETDNGRMARRERLLRGRLGLPQGLIERARAPRRARDGRG